MKFPPYSRLIPAFICLFTFTAFIFPNDKEKIVSVSEFQNFIDTIGLQFEMPTGYAPTVVKKNRDLWYCFAIKNKNADFEVRYSVWSLQPLINDYKKCQTDPNCAMVRPNMTYKGRAQTNALNMTGGISHPIGTFPTQAVKEEFNADAGGSSFFEFNCGFGTGYKYGQMIYLHKDNVADVIITYLSNDKAKHPELMNQSFHALTFKAQHIASYGKEVNGCKLAKDDAQNYYVVNKNDIAIASIDELNIDTEAIIDQIKKSPLKEAPLITKILEMHTGMDRTKELMHTTQTHDEINLLVLQNIDLKLNSKFSKEQLEKLKERVK